MNWPSYTPCTVIRLFARLSPARASIIIIPTFVVDKSTDDVISTNIMIFFAPQIPAAAEGFHLLWPVMLC